MTTKRLEEHKNGFRKPTGSLAAKMRRRRKTQNRGRAYGRAENPAEATKRILRLFAADTPGLGALPESTFRGARIPDFIRRDFAVAAVSQEFPRVAVRELRGTTP